MTYESFNPENKKNVAKAMALIFDDKNGIPYKLQCILGERLLWAATEYDDHGDWDKYFGPHYWSKGAIDKVLQNISGKDGSSIKVEHDLRHEHSIPKKVLNDELDRMHPTELSEINIFNFLMTHAFAVIVSKEEDYKLNKAGLRSKMPRDMTIKHDQPVDIFSRYKEVGVEIYKLERGMLASLKSGEIPSCGEGGLFSNRV